MTSIDDSASLDLVKLQLDLLIDARSSARGFAPGDAERYAWLLDVEDHLLGLTPAPASRCLVG
jgi:hypothetical protein